MYKYLLSSFFLIGLLFSHSSYCGVRICATKEQIQSACNTSNVKVAFIFNSKVHFIDFSQGNPEITQLTATNGAINPVISPDGAIVAYNTGIYEDPPTTDTNASIYICALNEGAQPSLIVQGGVVPRFDYSANEPVLVYSTCGKSTTGGSVWDGCGKVMKKILSSGDTTTVFEGGSYFGGLSFDGRYLATAESSPNAFLLDLQNQQQGPAFLHRLLVKELNTGNDKYIDLRTCNSSISSSRIFTNTMMYFDYSSVAIDGAGAYHPVLGYWDKHQRIFVARYDGAILKIYDAPQDAIREVASGENGKGEVVSVNWNHPEWSNHPYFATAATYVDRLWKETFYKHTYHNEGLYLINLKDSVYLKLAEVSDTSMTSNESILWPWVWIETPSNFAEIEDPSWLESTIKTKKRTSISSLSGNFHIKNNLLKVDGERIAQVRFFTHDGRLLWSRKFEKSQNEVLLPSKHVSGKLVLCDITLDSGRYVSASVLLR